MRYSMIKFRKHLLHVVFSHVTLIKSYDSHELHNTNLQTVRAAILSRQRQFAAQLTRP